MKRACAALLVLAGCASAPTSETGVRVRVLDSSGNLVRGAAVTLLWTSVHRRLVGTFTSEATTDAMGIVYLPSLPLWGREFAVTAIASGSGRASLRLGGSASFGIDVDLDLPATAAIDGVLEDPAGRPIPGARIEFHLETRPMDLLRFGSNLIDESVTTDDGGRFHCSSLDGQAEYRVVVTLSGQDLEVVEPERLRSEGVARIVARRRCP